MTTRMIEDANRIFDKLAANGRVKSDVIAQTLVPAFEATIDALMGKSLPEVRVFEAGSAVGDAQIAGSMQFDLTRLADPSEMLHALGEQLARDVAELMINGDTSCSDPFLMLLDGLKRLQTWPTALHIHLLSIAAARPSDTLVEFSMRASVRWVSSAPCA